MKAYFIFLERRSVRAATQAARVKNDFREAD
jgi:hypothetical protein